LDNKVSMSEGFVLSQQAMMVAAGIGLIWMISR